MSNVPAVLAGRCANGNERGKGAVVHIIPFHFSAFSLCGKTYGPRSAGWGLRFGVQPTCPRCIKWRAQYEQHQ